jgi:rhodanese-related sulfurtransferase
MKLNIDIVIDCAAPERVADFWAAALGYNKVGWFEPYFLLIAPFKGFPSFVLRRVTEPKTSKTHGRLNIRADDVHREAERLERLGATRVDVGHRGDDEAWIAMADPEGNGFRVCPTEPPPKSDTHRSGQSIDELLATTQARLDRVAPEALAAEHANGALIIDIRPAEQRTRDGELPDAVVIDRNVLEWRLDPQSEYRISQIIGYDTRIVIVCNEGYSSSLAAATLQELGLHRATDMIGGFQAWLTAHARTT